MYFHQINTQHCHPVYNSKCIWVNRELKADVSYDLVTTSCTYRACTNAKCVNNQAVKTTDQLTNVMLLQCSVDLWYIAGYQVAQHSLVSLHRTHHHRLTISPHISLSVCAILQPLMTKLLLYIIWRNYQIQHKPSLDNSSGVKQHQSCSNLSEASMNGPLGNNHTTLCPLVPTALKWKEMAFCPLLTPSLISLILSLLSFRNLVSKMTLLCVEWDVEPN